MKASFVVSVLSVLALGACTKPATPAVPAAGSEASAAPVAEAPAAAPAASAGTFTVQALSDADNTIKGCTTMLDRVGDDAHQVFLEDAVDTGAIGYVRIDGTRYKVALTKQVRDDKGGTRSFADKAHDLTVVETFKVGASHEDSDSVEMTGSLDVTFKGATQTIPVQGGTAC